MADTSYTDGVTIITADTMNDLNRLHYTLLGDPASVRAINDAIMEKGADVASAGTVNLTATTGDYVHITGTTTITAITLNSGDQRTVVFDGALTLTHNATTLILPGGANITTAAGDVAIFRGDVTGNTRCLSYVTALTGTLHLLKVAAIGSGRNITGRTTAANPTFQIDIDADELVLRDTSGRMLLAQTVNLTLDITVAGAGGLDTGAEAGNTWYYGWVIGKADGTINGVISTSTSAPTMPSGYTFKALVSAVRNNGSSNFIAYRQFGNIPYFEAQQSALSSGTATVETAVSLATFVPPIAHNVILNTQMDGNNSAGNYDNLATIRVVTGVDFWSQQGLSTNGSPAAGVSFPCGQLVIPNIGQSVSYLNSAGAGSPSFSIRVIGFQLPVGGE